MRKPLTITAAALLICGGACAGQDDTSKKATDAQASPAKCEELVGEFVRAIVSDDHGSKARRRAAVHELGRDALLAIDRRLAKLPDDMRAATEAAFSSIPAIAEDAQRLQVRLEFVDVELRALRDEIKKAQDVEPAAKNPTSVQAPRTTDSNAGLAADVQRMRAQLDAQAAEIARLKATNSALEEKLRATKRAFDLAKRRADWVGADDHAAFQARLTQLQHQTAELAQLAADYGLAVDRGYVRMEQIANPEYQRRLDIFMRNKIVDRIELRARQTQIEELDAILTAASSETVTYRLEGVSLDTSHRVFAYDRQATDTALRQISAWLGSKLTFARDASSLLGAFMSEIESAASAPSSAPSVDAMAPNSVDAEREQLWVDIEGRVNAEMARDRLLGLVWVTQGWLKQDVRRAFLDVKYEGNWQLFRNTLVHWLLPRDGQQFSPEVKKAWDAKWERMLDQAAATGYTRDRAGVQKWLMEKVYPALWENVVPLYEQGYWQ